MKNNKENLRSRYYAGEITVDQYVDQILNSKEGDRTRRNIERKYSKINQKPVLQKA
ncbi:hypothetical protein ACIFOE_23240 [Paenibacillus sp. NRS-1783]|uniref:hypothetical protein n=1 Tax=Paenibacillus sp. NRS-1783 TaxID=3233907 RepID=UPI003D2B4E33